MNEVMKKWLTVLLVFTLVISQMMVVSAADNNLKLTIETANGDELAAEFLCAGDWSCVSVYELVFPDNTNGIQISGTCLKNGNTLETMNAEYLFQNGKLINGGPCDYSYDSKNGTYNLPLSILKSTPEEIEDWLFALGINDVTFEEGYVYSALSVSCEDEIDDVGVQGCFILKSPIGSLDKTSLTASIDEATQLEAASFFTENDRWNGKTTNKNGFWNELQIELEKAILIQEAEDGITQAQVEEAEKRLSKAIAAVIKRENVNATELYELVQESEKTYSNADDYIAGWETYEAQLKSAKAMLASLYHESDGTPTSINTAAYQVTLSDKITGLNSAIAALEEKGEGNIKTLDAHYGRVFIYFNGLSEDVEIGDFSGTISVNNGAETAVVFTGMALNAEKKAVILDYEPLGAANEKQEASFKVAYKGKEKSCNFTLYSQTDWRGYAQKPIQGDGTADAPYEIVNGGELAWLELAVNRGETDVCATMTKDLDLSACGWVSIGNTKYPYTGTFDGAGFTVSGISSAKTKEDYWCFIQNNAGTIRNLTAVGDVVSTKGNFGGICGNNSGTIENCSYAGNIASGTNREISGFGGISLYNSGTISKSSHQGSLTIWGRNAGGICASNSGLITDCYNEGAVNMMGPENQNTFGGDRAIGGIAGTNSSVGAKGTVRRSYQLGVLHRSEAWGQNTGWYPNWGATGVLPVVGMNCNDSLTARGNVEDCYYLDYLSHKSETNQVTAPLSEDYRAFAGTKSIAGWNVVGTNPFKSGQVYYAYYDAANDHFIVVAPDSGTASNVIDAGSPGSTVVTCSTSFGVPGYNDEEVGGTVQKKFYLVTAPMGSTEIIFKNTNQIVDYTLGMNNDFFTLYDNRNHSSFKDRTMLYGSAVTGRNVDKVLNGVKDYWPEAYETMDGVFGKFIGSSGGGGDVPTEDTIKVSFRLVGSTLSPSGNIDRDKGLYDAEYVTWLKTDTYTLPKGSTVYDLFVKACGENGIRYDGAENGYVSKIYAPSVLGNYGLAEFTNGFRSGWMYTVNSRHPGVGLNSYVLKDKAKVIWHYVNDYSYDVSDWFDDPDYPNKGNSSTWDQWLKVADVNPTSKTNTVGISGQNTESTGDASVTLEAAAKTDSTGKATAAVSGKDIADALAKALAAVKAAENAGKNDVKPQVEIAVKADDKATAVETSVPASAVREIAKSGGSVKLSTPVGELTFDLTALTALGEQAGGSDIKLTVAKVDPSKTEALAANGALKGRPVFSLSAMSGEKTITGFKKGTVTLSLPYTIGKDEKETGLKLAYIDEKGAVSAVNGSKYNSRAKAMEGTTNHFSYYGILYQQLTFADVKAGDWFYDAVIYLAENNIVKGVTENTFGPEDSITRAEFVQILYNKNGAPAVTAASKFVDVKDSEWYAKAVAWAAEQGIVSGVKTADGNSAFKPEDKISRQDMAVILESYLNKVEKKELKAVNVKQAFADELQIEGYAKDAVEKMQSGGIISGVKYADGGYSFKPADNATRAEAASMLAKLFQK